MKIVKQEFTPVPVGAVRIIIRDFGGERITLQTTTRSEARMFKALAKYEITERSNKSHETKNTVV